MSLRVQVSVLCLSSGIAYFTWAEVVEDMGSVVCTKARSQTEVGMATNQQTKIKCTFIFIIFISSVFQLLIHRHWMKPEDN